MYSEIARSIEFGVGQEFGGEAGADGEEDDAEERGWKGWCCAGSFEDAAEDLGSAGDRHLVELGVAGECGGMTGGVGAELEHHDLPGKGVGGDTDRVAGDLDESFGSGDIVGDAGRCCDAVRRFVRSSRARKRSSLLPNWE